MNIPPAAVAAATRMIKGFQIAKGSDEEMIPVLEDLVKRNNIVLFLSHRCLTPANSQQIVNDFAAMSNDPDNPLFVDAHNDGRRHSGVRWAEYTRPILRQGSTAIHDLIDAIEEEWWIMNGKNIFLT
jgi:hypothetical protein